MENNELLNKFNIENNLIDNDILLRKLCDTKKDYELLEKWYKEKFVYSHFEQRVLDYDEIVNKYHPRTLDDTNVPVYMIEYKNQPVGIIQYQLINNESKKLYNLEDNFIYEMDIFIGEMNLHNKGIGTRTVILMSNHLFKVKRANLIVMCPLKNNINGIKCYEKAGFKKTREFMAKDTIGDTKEYVLMELKNN